MTTADRTPVHRRYLLGSATEVECGEIERGYFEQPSALEEIASAEDDLIGDYLDGQLTPDEQSRFERHYLSTPGHRSRVAILRALRTHAARAPEIEISTGRWWARFFTAPGALPARAQLAGALALVILAVLIWNINGPDGPASPGQPASETQRAEPERQPTPPSSREPAAIFAVSLSPINVRAGGAPVTMTIPSEAQTVALQLLRDGDERPVENGRAIVRTVVGADVWRGQAAPAADPAVLARFEVSAASLPPDDYIVELLEIDARGREVERNRYFFRVRQR
jgi:hypothetical protein